MICALIQKYVIAILTAILGSFMICYGFGFMTGLLDNFFDIIEKLKNGDKIGVANIVFFILFVIIAIVGLVMQFKLIAEEKREKQNRLSRKLILEN